jgi:ribosomal protein S18 acetylase RimI-like enzyme
VNLVGWHDCCVHALGGTSTAGTAWWTRPAREPSIYFTAIQTRPSGPDPGTVLDPLAEHLRDRRALPEAVCASWADLDLAPFGLKVHSEGRWYARAAPDPLPSDDWPRGLEVVRVTTGTDLVAFEWASESAFAGQPPEPGRVYAPALLADPAMAVLLGRVDGEPVAGAMAYRAGGVVGIYSVGTVAAHRERGYASALTRAALDVAGPTPAVLQPSLAAARLYRRLGFTEIGRFRHWGHRPVVADEA